MNKISILHEKDNVGTVIIRLAAGEILRYEHKGQTFELTVKEEIPLGHKVALENIEARSPIIKYGEVIGESTEVIEKGALVHVHNVESLRGRGDLAKEENR